MLHSVLNTSVKVSGGDHHYLPGTTMSEEPENPFLEGLMLLQQDHELDARMMNLLRPRTKSSSRMSPTIITHHPAKPHPAKPHPAKPHPAKPHPAKPHPGGSSINKVQAEGRGEGVKGLRGEGSAELKKDEDHNERRGREGREKESATGKREKGEEEEEKEEEEEDYNIFDEFLDMSTRARLGQLTGKVAALTAALHLAQEECRQVASSKRETSRAVQESERKCISLAKYTAGLKQEMGRLQKKNMELSGRVKELEQEGQALRKEASEAKVRVSGRDTGHASLKAQLNTANHKNEVENLKKQLREKEGERRKMEKEWRETSTLNKNQERLIDVLYNQKDMREDTTKVIVCMALVILVVVVLASVSEEVKLMVEEKVVGPEVMMRLVRSVKESVMKFLMLVMIMIFVFWKIVR